jgi:hypothetical protein
VVGEREQCFTRRASLAGRECEQCHTAANPGAGEAGERPVRAQKRLPHTEVKLALTACTRPERLAERPVEFVGGLRDGRLDGLATHHTPTGEGQCVTEVTLRDTYVAVDRHDRPVAQPEGHTAAEPDGRDRRAPGWKRRPGGQPGGDTDGRTGDDCTAPSRGVGVSAHVRRGERHRTLCEQPATTGEEQRRQQQVVREHDHHRDDSQSDGSTRRQQRDSRRWKQHPEGIQCGRRATGVGGKAAHPLTGPVQNSRQRPVEQLLAVPRRRTPGGRHERKRPPERGEQPCPGRTEPL